MTGSLRDDYAAIQLGRPFGLHASRLVGEVLVCVLDVTWGVVALLAGAVKIRLEQAPAAEPLLAGGCRH